MMLTVDIMHYMVYSYYLSERQGQVCTPSGLQCGCPSAKRRLAVRRKAEKNSASAIDCRPDEIAGSGGAQSRPFIV